MFRLLTEPKVHEFIKNEILSAEYKNGTIAVIISVAATARFFLPRKLITRRSNSGLRMKTRVREKKITPRKERIMTKTMIVLAISRMKKAVEPFALVGLFMRMKYSWQSHVGGHSIRCLAIA